MSEFSRRIGHLEGIESPWGNAGGVVKTVEDVERMAQTGAGWIEGGSFTLESRLGNAIVVDENGVPVPGAEPRRVYYHDPETGETYNSLGMPNKGMDIVETEIPEMVRIAEAHNKKLVVNVAPVGSDPVEEVKELVTRAYEAGAHGVVVNAGCPNVVTPDGGRHEILSHKPDVLHAVLKGLENTVRHHHPVWVRLSPYPQGSEHTMLRASQALWIPRGVVSAVLTPNTWPGHKPVDKAGNPILEVPGNIGGKSGPAMAEAVLHQVEHFVRLLKREKIDVIASSGIVEAGTLKRALGMGAVAGAGTTFFYESHNGWQDDTNRLLHDLAA